VGLGGGGVGGKFSIVGGGVVKGVKGVFVAK